MKANIMVEAILTVERTGPNTAAHGGCSYRLFIPKELDVQHYFDQNGSPNITGGHVVTDVLVQALIGNIHAMHQEGKIDSAQHLRRVIKELERGFIAQVKIEHK
jgi:hypothetical protein